MLLLNNRLLRMPIAIEVYITHNIKAVYGFMTSDWRPRTKILTK